MNNSRFGRTGRCRFFICFSILVLMMGMVVIFHNTQAQLDETRQQRLLCEQQQEAVNERLTSLVEQKFHLEKFQERERNEQMETKRNFERRIKDLEEQMQKDKLQAQLRYDKLQQTHKLLQNDHFNVLLDCSKTKKQHLEDSNALEKKFQSLLSEIEKEKTAQLGELNVWKEKYKTIEREKLHLEDILNNPLNKTENKLHFRIKELEEQLQQYKQLNNSGSISSSAAAVAAVASPLPVLSQYQMNESLKEISFNKQEPVSDGVYYIPVNINEHKFSLNTNNNQHIGTTSNLTVSISNQNQNSKLTANDDVNSQQLLVEHNNNLILNSVENFQIVPKPIESHLMNSNQHHQPTVKKANGMQAPPLGAPKNSNSVTSTVAVKPEQQQMQAAAAAATTANLNTTSSKSLPASSNIKPKPLMAAPSLQKKLPENVAPIPEDFETLLEKSNIDESKQKNNEDHNNNNNNNNNLDRKDDLNHDENTNNRYKNIAEDMTQSKSQYTKDGKVMDLKDNGNGEQLSAAKSNAEESNNLKDEEHDDEEMLMAGGNDNDMLAGIGERPAGDIPVINNNQQLLDADNLNNEVVADQGKEFGDSLRLDEADNDDGDDDDYSLPESRKQEGEAIRN